MEGQLRKQTFKENAEIIAEELLPWETVSLDSFRSLNMLMQMLYKTIGRRSCVAKFYDTERVVSRGFHGFGVPKVSSTVF